MGKFVSVLCIGMFFVSCCPEANAGRRKKRCCAVPAVCCPTQSFAPDVIEGPPIYVVQGKEVESVPSPERCTFDHWSTTVQIVSGDRIGKGSSDLTDRREAVIEATKNACQNLGIPYHFGNYRIIHVSRRAVRSCGD
jgi:hypothetical protein